MITLCPTIQGGGEAEVLFRFDGSVAGERLGEALSLGGDINADGTPDILVGAEFADVGGLTRAGMVVVYSGLDGSLLYQFSGSAAFENFGTAVVSLGDINGDGFDDILIGSPGADPLLLANAGEIDIFSGADGSSLQHIDGTADHALFGSAVAALGDINADGVPDFMVAEAGRNSDAGRVYIYSGLTSGVIYQIDGLGTAALGTGVSSAGDYDLDGTPDFMIGSPFADTGGRTDNGIVQIFSGLTGLEISLLEGLSSLDYFGSSVSGNQNINDDATPDFIIGSPNRNPGGIPSAGSATVFDGATATALFQVTGASIADNLGSSVALAGDVNGDGFGDFIIGARLLDAGGLLDAGSVFVFSGLNGDLLLRADGGNSQDNMGDSVAGGVDINGDGYAEAAYAIPFDDTAGILAGAVEVQRLAPILNLSQPSISDLAGGSVAFDLDFPLSEAGSSYILLASRSGFGPTSFRGVFIPLTVDSLFNLMATGAPSVFTNNTGTLSVTGDASPMLTLPNGGATGLIGTTVLFSAVSHNGGVPSIVSNTRGLEILP
ncbi:MAG: integrin alpha [Planctomycetota bacterium]|nr:integrin alpha [Planctomycetota bacterium]MDA1113113.1 integrin alpha [Planctomycetota bacterium]